MIIQIQKGSLTNIDLKNMVQIAQIRNDRTMYYE